MGRIDAILRKVQQRRDRSSSDKSQGGPLPVEGVRRLLGAELSASAGSATVATQASWLIEKLPDRSIAVMMDEVDWPPKVYALSHQDRYTPAEFVEKAASAGSACVLTSRVVENPSIPTLTVPNTREALWTIAADVRSRYEGEVIGITGTVGKSTTKSMLHEILSERSTVVSTPRNWNTIDGVAQAVTALGQDPDFAVLEATIHCFTDRHESTARKIIQPTVGVVTAIGEAHRDVAPTLSKTAELKGRLLGSLRPGGLAVISRDSIYFDSLQSAAAQGAPREVLTFGGAVESDYRLLDWSLEDGRTRVKAALRGKECEYIVGSPGKALALNSLAALAVVDGIGRSVEDAISSLENYRSDRNVSAMHKLSMEGGSALLIDDSTNATYLSMVAAFELLVRADTYRSGKKIVILGQINFLGNAAQDVHASLAQPLLDSGVDLVVTVGRGMEGLIEALGSSVHLAHAASPHEAADMVWNVLEPGDRVLVKGSNINTGFRQAGRRLRQLGAGR